MPSRNRYRSASKFTNQSTRTASGARTAWRFTEKAAVGLARWATTDHTGSAKFLASLPPMGFIDTMHMILVTFVTGILGACVAGFLMFLLIAYGIPWLLFL
jgi:K+-transporting ATPase A subunit